MITHGPIGVFGKLPAQGDFLRLNAADPVAQGLQLWFEEGVATLHRAGVKLSGEPVRFVYRIPSSPKLLVGVFTPSVDKVGRQFPLAIFVTAQAKEAAAQYQLLPAGYRGFLDAAAALLAEAPRLDGRQLAERLPILPLPAASQLTGSETLLRRSAVVEQARGFSERLFGELALGFHYYAYWIFQSACTPVRAKEPPKANVALDCPATQEVDVFAWLDLSRRLLRWPAPPPFFWREGPAGQVLVSVGPAMGSLFAYLSDPTRNTNKVWPLKTTVPAAVSSARQALGPAQLAAIDRAGASLEELIEMLSR